MTLRHTYAVHFLEDGGTIRQLQEILGHETIEPTMRYQGLVRDQSNHPVLEPLITLHPKPDTLVAAIFPLAPEVEPSFADRLRQQLKGRYLAIKRFLRPGLSPPRPERRADSSDRNRSPKGALFMLHE